MSWVAWKQRHLWSGAPCTTCYSSGWSTYYYNCRCWAKTCLCWVILEYFHQSDQKKNYVIQLVSFKNTCAYSFLWIAIHWVCRIDTNRSDKISLHRDAPVNRYIPTARPPAHLPARPAGDDNTPRARFVLRGKKVCVTDRQTNGKYHF